MFRKIDNYFIERAEWLVEFLEDRFGISKDVILLNLTIMNFVCLSLSFIIQHKWLLIMLYIPFGVLGIIGTAFQPKLVEGTNSPKRSVMNRIMWWIVFLISVYILFFSFDIFIFYTVLACIAALLEEYIEAGNGNTGKRVKAKSKKEAENGILYPSSSTS